MTNAATVTNLQHKYVTTVHRLVALVLTTVSPAKMMLNIPSVPDCGYCAMPFS